MTRVQIAQSVPGLVAGAQIDGLPDVTHEGRVVGRTVDASAETDRLVLTVDLDDDVLPETIGGVSIDEQELRPVWRLDRVDPGRRGNITINSPIIARAPGCPAERHPTRDCGCRVFKRWTDAERYVEEQHGQVAPEDLPRPLG